MVCAPNRTALSAFGPWLSGRCRPIAATKASRPAWIVGCVSCWGVSPATAATLTSADHCSRVTTGLKPSSAERALNRAWNAR